MTFRSEPDPRVADWWLGQDVVDDPWVTCLNGPPGYAAYVRFRHHDPEAAEREVLWLLLDSLAAHTGTVDDVVVAQWEGNLGEGGVRYSVSGREVVEPSPLAEEVLRAPRARLQDSHGPIRDYVLLRGPLSELGAWPARDRGLPVDLPEVVCGAMWPQDRAWFYAWDVDDDEGATIACDEELAAVLLADHRYAAWRVERS